MQLRGDVRARRVLIRRGELERADSHLLDDDRARGGAGDQGILAQARLAYNSLRVRVDSDATVEDELAQATRDRRVARGIRRAGGARDRAHRDRNVQVPARSRRRRRGRPRASRRARPRRLVGRAPARGDGRAASAGRLGADARVGRRRSLRGAPLRRLCERGAQGSGAPDSLAVPRDARRRRGVAPRCRRRVGPDRGVRSSRSPRASTRETSESASSSGAISTVRSTCFDAGTTCSSRSATSACARRSTLFSPMFCSTRASTTRRSSWPRAAGR